MSEERDAGVELERPEEREVSPRLASIRVGLWLAVIVTVGTEAYALFTWSEPNRGLITVMCGLALLSILTVSLLPLERIVRGVFREPFFVTWSILNLALIAVIAAADGGTASPFALLFVLPVLFGSMSYPLRGTIAVGAFAVVAYLAVAIHAGDGVAVSLAGAFALTCACLLCSWESRDQASRRRALAETADALHVTERRSRLLADQQHQVASFGQHALGGAEIDHLCEEAVRIIRDTLAVDIAAVLKHVPERDALVIRNAVGMPDDAIGEEVPLSEGSQAGYTLESGEAVIVRDWDTETRLTQSTMLRRLGVLSGVTTLIRANESSFGVLGMQTYSRRDFSSKDVNFLQSIANVLANAIERRTAEERNRHEALHDPLTSLPNRNLYLDRLGHALAQSARRGSSVAVLFMDLDQFKLVNDSLGHAAGDELLQAVAERFEQVLRPGDTVARFGGDEFAVLLEDVDGERDASRVAERIGESLARPFVLRKREHFVSVSIGISIGRGDEPPEALIRDADAALYRAKERGRGRYEIFDSVMRARVVENMETENDLRRAHDRGEFALHYQPVVSLTDGSVEAFEALIRWRHPQRGLLAPPSFLSAAEDSQLIIPIGHRLLGQACRAAAEWQALDPDATPARVCINLSARQLTDPKLPIVLEAAIEASGLEPITIDLEMTESALLEESEAPERCLRSLKDMGVRLVLDDFGTGFSSLGYLRRFPLDAIKLDRSFVEHLADRAADAAIVQAVVEMAGALELDVIAEGVETAGQLRVIRELGCRQAQGFYFCGPVPRDQIGALLRDPPWAAVGLGEKAPERRA